MENKTIKPFILCSICGMKLSSFWSLTRHTRTHSGIKPFKCSLRECGKEFIEKCALKRHEQTHTNSREWTCNFKDCSRKFKLKEYLVIHKRTHKEEIKLTCQSSSKEGHCSSFLSTNISLGRIKRPYRERAIKGVNSESSIQIDKVSQSSHHVDVESIGKSTGIDTFNSNILDNNHFQQLISSHKMFGSLSYPSLPPPLPSLPSTHHLFSLPSTMVSPFTNRSTSETLKSYQNLTHDANKNDIFPTFNDNISTCTSYTTMDNFDTCWKNSNNVPSSIFPPNEYNLPGNILHNELIYNPAPSLYQHQQPGRLITQSTPGPTHQQKEAERQQQYEICAINSLQQQHQQRQQQHTTSLAPTSFSSISFEPDAFSCNDETEEIIEYLQQLDNNDDDTDDNNNTASILPFDFEWEV